MADPLLESEVSEARLEELRRGLAALREAIGQSFLGHDDAVETLLLCVLAGGHALLEGAPGLGKTTLVRSLAAGLDLSFRRIQFTPDLMPGDIVGTRMIEEDAAGARHFTFQGGPVFAHIVLADEINRATPRTQSALLEAMQEGQVTVFGETHRLEQPFCVIATQNPIEMEGTYPLPEAQLDRFMAKIEIRSPGRDELVAILGAGAGSSGELPAACLGRDEVLRLRGWVREVPVSSDVVDLVAGLVLATDPRDAGAPEEVRRFVRFGASPRGGRAVLDLARARALARGRLHVTAEDLEAVCVPALRHRLIMNYEGEASGTEAAELIRRAFAAAAARS